MVDVLLDSTTKPRSSIYLSIIHDSDEEKRDAVHEAAERCVNATRRLLCLCLDEDSTCSAQTVRTEEVREIDQGVREKVIEGNSPLGRSFQKAEQKVLALGTDRRIGW